jgi:hypothetical protein
VLTLAALGYYEPRWSDGILDDAATSCAITGHRSPTGSTLRRSTAPYRPGHVLVATEPVPSSSRAGPAATGGSRVIEYPDGPVTAYTHGSRQNVTNGETIVRGQRFGLMEATGDVTGEPLHIETRVGGRAVNVRRSLVASC